MSNKYSSTQVSILALLISGLLVTSCARKTEGLTAQPNDLETGSIFVPVAKVVHSHLSNSLAITGEFIPYQEVDVMAKEAGYVKSIGVDIGDRVKAGQVLAELEIPEIDDDITRTAANVEAAEADIAKSNGDMTRAQTSRDIAELSYKRILGVSQMEAGLIPQQEVDVAHSKLLETNAQVAAAGSTLEAAKRKAAVATAEHARWKTMKKYTIIASPFTGVITKRYANTGSMIQQGTSSDTQAMPVVRVSQTQVLRLIVPVPESAVPGVHVGQSVEVTATALQKTFPGRITRFENKISMATRTMNTEIDVQNPDYILVPGMYAQVNLHLANKGSVLAVPLDALEQSEDQQQIYAVRDGKVRIIPVTVGVKTSRQSEIRSGLNEGDLVIVGRHTGLRDGQPVRPKIVDLDAVDVAEKSN